MAKIRLPAQLFPEKVLELEGVVAMTEFPKVSFVLWGRRYSKADR